MKKYILFSTTFLLLVFSILTFISCGEDEAIITNNLPSDLPAEEDSSALSFQKSCKTIMDRIVEENVSAIQNVNTLDNVVNGHLQQIKEDGSFPDVDYSDKSQTNWKPEAHLDKLKQMSLVYVISKSTYYQKQEVYDKIVKALEYWNECRPTSSNWWYNQVSAPKKMGVILILLRSGKKKLPVELENILLQYWQETGGDPTDSNREGANKVDIALHWLYRGCLQQDREVVDIATSEAFAPLAYTTSEGIQYDNSYFQHNEQLYIGGYASVLLRGAVNVAIYTLGTDYTLSNEQINTLSGFVRGTLLKCIRGKYMFYNVMGRGVSRKGELEQASAMIGLLEKLKQIDVTHVSEYDQAITILNQGNSADYTNVSESLTHYYVGDFTLYQSAGYSMGVRMVSDRTYRCEEGNGENLKGYFLSDGSMAISLAGNEYEDIFPIWDWCKVPGVTAPQIADIPVMNNWTHKGESNFVGGVSDGHIGVSAYKMNNQEDGINISANKSWFFWGKEVVCLGSNISSTMSEEIATTVNQCLMSGNISYLNNGIISALTEGQTLLNTSVDWAWHKNIGYFFPSNQQVSIKAERKTGNWSSINTSQSGSKTQVVCSIGLNHGTAPSNKSYSYIIVPNITSEAMAGYNVSNLEILSNTATMHAVRNKMTGVTQIVFYEGGTLKINDLEVSADKGCLMILKESGDIININLADPSHKLSDLTLYLKRSGKEVTETLHLFSNDGYHKGKTHYIRLVLKDK